jgi:hypothetical protein
MADCRRAFALIAADVKNSVRADRSTCRRERHSSVPKHHRTYTMAFGDAAERNGPQIPAIWRVHASPCKSMQVHAGVAGQQGGGGGSDLAHCATFALALPAMAVVAAAMAMAATAAAAATVAATAVLAVPKVADVDGKGASTRGVDRTCTADGGGGAPLLLSSLSPNSIAAHRMR